MISQRQLKAVRDKLEIMLDALSGSRHDTRDLALERSTEASDTAQSEVAIDEAVRTLNQEWELRRAVEQALDQISAGEYGRCASCGDPIHAKRLRAVPWATLCVDCQAHQEAQQGQSDLPQAA